ncbi:MAG TPA: suppressor of fused domain protein, partial [Streptosporangiaceae bacterium]
MDTPVTLLESSSPYGSRRVTVEYDGLTTAAYLHDDTAVISSTWIANHQPAPDSIDSRAQARLDAGRTPLMPASLIKHPGGRGSLRGSALQALWFEEGDGVAILENGQPLAVIAGWSDMDRGMPGYSRDVIGQTPFGWSLDEAMEGLAPRLERSRAYWRWR